MQLFILAVSILLLAAYILLILYYRHWWRRIPAFSIKDLAHPVVPSTKLSVIIAARNEEQNIKECLNSIISQNYPAHLFEIIVVDDHSTDNTASIVRNTSAENIRLISLKDHTEQNQLNSYKKKAIEIAIGQSTGSIIVTTDADCVAENDWLPTIDAFYQKTRAALMAMPVAYHKEKNFFSAFQSLDFMTMQGITGAAVHHNIHTMCNGANLAYEKNAFYEVNGFTGIDNIASGDDMLLMYKIYQRYPEKIFFIRSEDAIVKTSPVDSLSGFFNQRIRWASKADKYHDTRITNILLLVYFFNLTMLLLPLIALFKKIEWQYGNFSFHLWQLWSFMLIIKTITELFFLYPVAIFFSKTNLLKWFPPAQPFHIIYTIITGWLGKFGSYKWKERKVK